MVLVNVIHGKTNESTAEQVDGRIFKFAGAGMTPTLIVLGLVVGRWWLVLIVAVAWPIVLIGTKVGTGFVFVVESALLASANTVVGVVLHKALLGALRKLRTRSRDT